MLSAARINAEYSRRQRLNDMSEVAGDQIVSEFSIFKDGEEVHGSSATGREYTNLRQLKILYIMSMTMKHTHGLNYSNVYNKSRLYKA